MKMNRQIVLSFLLLIVIGSIYRIMPGRPLGFAPQIAMAIFGGAVIKDKKWAFLLPVLSMFISDALFEAFFRLRLGITPGFYEGQLTNYILFGLMTIFGFIIRKINVPKVVLACLAAPTAFFLLSNFFVWVSSSTTAGLGRPKTFDGLLQCYNDGLPFYTGSLYATFVFSTILFGGYYMLRNYVVSPSEKIA